MRKTLSGILLGSAALYGCSSTNTDCHTNAHATQSTIAPIAQVAQAPRYKTNVYNSFDNRQFSDKDFDHKYRGQDINGKTYVFIDTANQDAKIGNTTIDTKDVFPFAAYERSKVVIDNDPKNNTATIHYADGSALVFTRDAGLDSIVTGIPIKAKEMPQGQKSALFTESQFEIEYIDFSREGYIFVPYIEDANSKDIILMVDPLIRENYATGTLEFVARDGKTFIQKEGTLVAHPTPVPATQPVPKPRVNKAVQVRRIPQTQTVPSTQPTKP